MAVVIRLSRVGTKNQPKYRVNVADSRRCRDGKYLEIVGNFDPSLPDVTKRVTLNLDRIQYWIKKGAKASERVNSLMKKYKPELTK